MENLIGYIGIAFVAICWFIILTCNLKIVRR